MVIPETERLNILSSPLRKRVTVGAIGAVVLGGLTTTAASATEAAAPPAPEIATGGSDGWATEAASTGATAFVASPDSPLGTGAARLTTGTGDLAGNTSGKAYLYQSGLGGTALADLTELGYSTKVQTLGDPDSKLAPSMGLSLMSDAGWQGTLVFEPIYQDQAPEVGTWQTWDAADGKWWFTRNVVDTDGNVVIAKQNARTLDEVRAAFDANPAKYGNIRLDPRGGGVQVYAGTSAYMEAWNGFSALVDNVTVGTADGTVSTWDLEQGLGSVPVTVEGNVYTLLEDGRTFNTINVPNHATVDGAGHTITAAQDAAHKLFVGPVLASATGDDKAAAELNVKNLDITTSGFLGGSEGKGLSGISLNRAGGTLTDVSVSGVSFGNGNQEGNAISIRNRVSADDINVPRASVSLEHVDVSNYQKTGLLLDGNLAFRVDDATVGAGAGPEGQDNSIIAANSLQVSRGASGTVTNSHFALNSHAEASAVLLYNAKKVDLDHVVVTGNAPAEMGVAVSNGSNTIDTDLTIRHSLVERTNGTGGTGLYVDDTSEGAITTTATDTRFVGWEQGTSAGVVHTPTAPVVTKVEVTGKSKATRPSVRSLKIVMKANELRANQAEGKALRWRITVDGRLAAVARQHAGDSDLWKQHFGKGTGTHTVALYKNGELRRTLRVATT